MALAAAMLRRGAGASALAARTHVRPSSAAATVVRGMATAPMDYTDALEFKTLLTEEEKMVMVGVATGWRRVCAAWLGQLWRVGGPVSSHVGSALCDLALLSRRGGQPSAHAHPGPPASPPRYSTLRASTASPS
jgi:hypothetical protein